MGCPARRGPEILKAVAIEYRDHLANVAMNVAAESEAAYVAGGGTIIDVPAADLAAWANAMSNIAGELADTLNDAGEPGDEMLAAYLGKLKVDGFEGVRDCSVR